MNVGEYIKMLRTQKGITQEELGELVGVKRAAVNKWESGMVQNLKRTTIQRLSEIFQVSPVSFIEGSMQPSELPMQSGAQLTPRENVLLTNYRKLNSEEQQKADNYVENLVKVSEGSKPNIIQKPIAAFGGAETLTVDSDVLKAAIDAALREKGLI